MIRFIFFVWVSVLITKTNKQILQKIVRELKALMVISKEKL